MSLLERFHLWHADPPPRIDVGELLHWDGTLSVGNGLIDNEHREIVSILNALYSDWQAGAHHLDLLRTLGKLDATLRTHFTNEEKIMARHHYPSLDQHKAAHISLLDEMDSVSRSLRLGSAPDAEERLTRFVRKVVMDHVVVWDMDAKEHLKE